MASSDLLCQLPLLTGERLRPSFDLTSFLSLKVSILMGPQLETQWIQQWFLPHAHREGFTFGSFVNPCLKVGSVKYDSERHEGYRHLIIVLIPDLAPL